MPIKISDSVVVITGASSGIGRAAALEFAGRGANVVLAARRQDALEAAAAECRQYGGRAVAVPTDVSDENSVRELARRTVGEFGRIDVWVNNAAVATAGRFMETPMDPFRKVMETNFFGYVHGARAVMPIFQAQGKGVLINNSSMVGRFSEPYFSSYVASKHAIRGFGMSLRQELGLKGNHDIHICTLLPAAMDTPFFQHAANYSGRALKALPPVYPAAKVAKAMVACAMSPRREFFVGNSARFFNLQYALSRALGEKSIAKSVDRFHFYQDRAVPPSDGNVFAPMADGDSVSGGWRTATGRHADESPDGLRGLKLGKGAWTAAGLALAAGTIAYMKGGRIAAMIPGRNH